jgi:hypothetical protein
VGALISKAMIVEETKWPSNAECVEDRPASGM